MVKIRNACYLSDSLSMRRSKHVERIAYALASLRKIQIIYGGVSRSKEKEEDFRKFRGFLKSKGGARKRSCIPRLTWSVNAGSCCKANAPSRPARDDWSALGDSSDTLTVASSARRVMRVRCNPFSSMRIIRCCSRS